jgi:hypothetical protein
MSQKICKIRYEKHPDIDICHPINWNMDPFKVKNWRHNFLSLRWLPSQKSPDIIREVILSFYDFHYVKNKKNNMIRTRAGDHSTAIRLGHLANFRKLFMECDDKAMTATIEALISLDIKALLMPSVYRPGHNHGVMADTA